MQIGVLGATGPAGQGLAARLASVGHDVIAGSRDRARAEAAIAELRARWGERVATLVPGTNAEAATAPDLVIVATNWQGVVDTARDHADALAGSVVISMASGLEKQGREFRAVIPEAGSIAQAVQAASPGARVVAAFQHVPAASFAALDVPLESDVVVVADDDAAKELVFDLIATMANLRAFDGGGLANALGVEVFAAVLLTCNLRAKGKGTLRLLGLEARAAGTATGS